MTGMERMQVGSRRRRRSGKVLTSGLAAIMLVGTLGYVVRDNFRVSASTTETGARTTEVERSSEQSRACLDRGDSAGALEHASRAVALGPGSAAAQLSLAAALAANGDLDGARAALDVAERLEPEHPDMERTQRILEQAQQ